MPNAHESTDPWPAPPQEDRSSPDPSSALQALQPLCFTQALFDNRSALEAVLAHLFTPSFEDFADFEDAELENDSDISAEPSVPAGWAATVMAIPDTLSPDLERALTALLPEETQHRLMRFTHPARRLQSLFGRLLAQRLALPRMPDSHPIICANSRLKALSSPIFPVFPSDVLRWLIRTAALQ